MIYKHYIHYNEHEVKKIGDYGRYFPSVIKDPHYFVQEQKELRDTL
jgi:hypothetical protein